MFRTQKDTIRKGIQNNAGFTLIEMIVTVAIIAIFSGVVVTLIGTGSNLFRGVSGNTKSQIECSGDFKCDRRFDHRCKQKCVLCIMVQELIWESR